jgi:hypothetical protein
MSLSLDRLLQSVRKDEAGCWIWQGQLGSCGYGRVYHDGKMRSAHRAAWTLVNGPIPQGLEIDHLCRVRNCINPSHLEAVTHAENCQRGTAGLNLAAFQRAKTHCPQGHPYSGENLYLPPSGGRICRTCRQIAVRRWQREKQKAWRAAKKADGVAVKMRDSV